MQENIITKKLCPTDVKSKLIVPTKSLPKFNLPDDRHFIRFEATDTSDKRWNFRLSTRIDDPNGNLRPEITGDWIQFVKEKGLEAGDNYRVILDKKVDEATGDEQFFIKAEFKLFGKWYNLK